MTASQTMETVEGDIRFVVVSISTAGQALSNSLEGVLGSISAVRYELASGDDR